MCLPPTTTVWGYNRQSSNVNMESHVNNSILINRSLCVTVCESHTMMPELIRVHKWTFVAIKKYKSGQNEINTNQPQDGKWCHSPCEGSWWLSFQWHPRWWDLFKLTCCIVGARLYIVLLMDEGGYWSRMKDTAAGKAGYLLIRCAISAMPKILL